MQPGYPRSLGAVLEAALGSMAGVLERELAFANELADEATEIAMGVFRRDVEVTWKADLTPVTQADTQIESTIRKRLAEAFPDDAVLGEEQGGEEGIGRIWVIDPIDGTRNFASGIQIWSTLIALVVDREPVMGVVSAPALGERYQAVRGAGATMNGESIHVSDVGSLADAGVTTGDVQAWFGTPMDDRMRALESRAKRRRGFGDFWGHVLVARGSMDVMIEPTVNIWDWAALVPVVTEAGGRLSQVDGSPLVHGGSILTTNGRLHDQAVELLTA
jgi:histidinol-phosphatase